MVLFSGSSPSPASAPQMTPQQANMLNRQACIRQGVDMWQQIFQQTSTAGVGAIINLPLRNVGLIKRLYIRVAAEITTPATDTHTLTSLGLANFFSNITFTDLSNQTRINTSGWHLMMVSSAKRRRVFGAAVTTDTPLGYGSAFNPPSGATGVMSAPASLAASTTYNVYAIFEVPFAYTDTDLRGAIYANVTNATLNLQLTVNPAMFAASTADPTLSVYQSSAALLPTLTSFTLQVYQNYLDQLPVQQNGFPALPVLDLSTAYLLNNTPVGAVVQNQDNPIPYANFRDFMSTTVIYDNNGTLNVGSDLAYLEIQSANYTNIIKFDPFTSAMQTRLILANDAPKGTYYFDHRHKPISTIQYGNMQLVINPSNVGGNGASFLMGYEALALINQITQAGSLYGV